MNKVVSYSDLRQTLKKVMDDVCESSNPILIKRRAGHNVVMISEEDFSSLEETCYLLKSPANSKRLMDSVNRQKSERKRFNNIEALENETRNRQ